MSVERGMVVWVTSARADAAQEVAVLVAEALAARELPVELLHAERPGLEPLGTPPGLAAVAALLASHGVHSVVAESSASRAMRDEVLAAAREDDRSARTGRCARIVEAPAQAEAEVNAAAGPEASPACCAPSSCSALKPRDDLDYSPDEEREGHQGLKAFWLPVRPFTSAS
jgi:hypothetical protein